jgi:phosphotransferase system IIA component
VSGKILKLLPHAYVIMTAENVGVLVHLGLDTVRLNGAGFTPHVAQGDTVTAGQAVINYDVPAIVAAGYSPVVPVVVMDERDSSNISIGDAVNTNADIPSGAMLFTANK